MLFAQAMAIEKQDCYRIVKDCWARKVWPGLLGASLPFAPRCPHEKRHYNDDAYTFTHGWKKKTGVVRR